MQTIKIKYTTAENSAAVIREYRRQYSHALHYAYNRRMEDISEKDTEKMMQGLNNVPLVKSYLRRCAVKTASQLVKSREDGKKVIFGGRNNCVRRAQGLISVNEYRERRIGMLTVIGEANRKANRMVRICKDLNSFTFTPEHTTSMVLTIAGGYRRYKPFLKKLYELQEDRAVPITYAIDGEYIRLTFDEALVFKEKVKAKPIKNRVFAIDLNPNYVGWSVVDWLSSSRFNVVESGTVSIKAINDVDFALKDRKLSSDSPERLYINAKRTHEVLEIAKMLVTKAMHFRCEMFAMESLGIRPKDCKKGSKYNKLVNNMWNRNKLEQNLRKRCSCRGLRFMTVPAEYSSFIANFLYRSLRLPDMVLASIEIGRRAYEFHGQYETKEKIQRKNIVIPEVNGFGDWYAKSLEEFGVPGDIREPVDVYKFLKESKSRYRLSLELLLGSSLKFSRCFSWKSGITNIFVIPDNVS